MFFRKCFRNTAIPTNGGNSSLPSSSHNSIGDLILLKDLIWSPLSLLRNSDPHYLGSPTSVPRMARNETYAKDIIKAWKADANPDDKQLKRDDNSTFGSPFPYKGVGDAGDKEYAGYLVVPSTVDVNNISEKLPVVMLFHTGAGPQDIFNRYIADKLAREKMFGSTGCIIFIADILSDSTGWTWGDRPKYRDERDSLNRVAERDGQKCRWKMRDVVSGALSAVKSIAAADMDRIAAWGFCVGGQPVLELGRMQQRGVKGLITFHGMFEGVALPDKDALIIQSGANTKRKVLICNGKNDDFVTASDLDLATETFERSGWKCRVLNFERAVHNFSNPRTEYDDAGFGYDENASVKSWEAAIELLKDVFEL